jgi:hypothetical protein
MTGPNANAFRTAKVTRLRHRDSRRFGERQHADDACSSADREEDRVLPALRIFPKDERAGEKREQRGDVRDNRFAAEVATEQRRRDEMLHPRQPGSGREATDDIEEQRAHREKKQQQR